MTEFVARWHDRDGEEWTQTERGFHVSSAEVPLLWNRDEVESNFGPLTPVVPDRLPIAEHDAFLDPVVARLIRELEGPIFKYRMAKGQLARAGYPRRLRAYEAEIRAAVTRYYEVYRDE